MKRILLLGLLIVPSVCQAQYWGERATERSFENSALHFQSHFLNTFGLVRFKDVTVGTIDDPFLNLQLNPANLPRGASGIGNSLIYFDFRGDRTEPPVIGQYYDYIYDPYYFPIRYVPSIPRQEPEPIFSFGMLAYPFRDNLRKLLIGTTYQLIYEEEPYYTTPQWIYYSRFGYDSFGNQVIDEGVNIPVQDRFYGNDELSTEGHLFSVFTGYPISDGTDLGLSINTVSHSREGSYINSQSDAYGASNDWEYIYYQSRERDLQYSHFDIAAGIRQELSRSTTGGIKLGWLSGEADQFEMTVDSSRYVSGDSLTDNSWSYSLWRSMTDQAWNRDGSTKYFQVNFEHEVDRDRKVSGYYYYGNADIDLRNSSHIADTSNYASHHVWSSPQTIYDYWSRSATHDDRTGKGQLEEDFHTLQLNLDWKVTRDTRVNLGVHFGYQKSDLMTDEPVTSDRWSEYFNSRSDTGYTEYRDFFRLTENKVLTWNYRTTYRTLQIPVLLRHRINEHFSVTLGVNRILESRKIEDETLAIYDRREQAQNGQTTIETDFAERYRQPDQKITTDFTAILGSVELKVSRQFKVRLMAEPETEGDFRINQWWLAFELGA